MTLDLTTLAFISCLTFAAQFIALLVQYSLNRTYGGVRWWLLGSCLWAVGLVLMPLVAVKSLEVLARIANPLVVLGLICLHIGTARFLNKTVNWAGLLAIFAASNLSYYYFMFGDNNISGRSVAISITLAVLALMTAARLWQGPGRFSAGSARFTALVFMVYGGFTAVRVLVLLVSPPMQAYSDQQVMMELAFIIPLLTGLLWTFGFIIMVNQRLNAENHEEKEKLRLIFNTSPEAAVISRLADGQIMEVNDGFLAMSGYARAEIIGHSTVEVKIWPTPADRDRFVAALRAQGSCENLEMALKRKDGRVITGSLSARPITIAAVPHVISVVHDITHNKQAEAALRESEALYRSILNASPDDITITDLHGRILVISPAAKQMFGYPPEYDQFVGTPLLDYILPAEREQAQANIRRMFAGGYAGPNEYHGRRQDGSVFDIEANSALIPGADGQPAKMVFMVRDISERKRTEQHVQELVRQLEIEKKAAQLNANTDSLTGLANRRYFDAALNAEFQRLRRSGLPLSLIMLDVDHFKAFNDRYGHLAGDDCLRQIGATLKPFAGRVTDTVARYGGEEFVVLLAETDLAGAETLAERIRQAVAAQAIPHAASGVADYVTVSLGVVTVDPARLASPEQAVALADEALYSAKKAGRNRTAVAAENARLAAEVLVPG